MALGDRHIPRLIEKLGVSVAVVGGGASTKGIVRQFSEVEHGFEGAGELVKNSTVVTIETGSLGGVQPGPPPKTMLAINGVEHRVIKSMAIEHGRLTRIYCQVDPQDWIDE